MSPKHLPVNKGPVSFLILNNEVMHLISPVRICSCLSVPESTPQLPSIEKLNLQQAQQQRIKMLMKMSDFPESAQSLRLHFGNDVTTYHLRVQIKKKKKPDFLHEHRACFVGGFLYVLFPESQQMSEGVSFIRI